MKENNDAKVVLSSRVLFLVKCKNIQYSFVSVIRVMGFLFNMLVDSDMPDQKVNRPYDARYGRL